jgi:hypothetical protein
LAPADGLEKGMPFGGVGFLGRRLEQQFFETLLVFVHRNRAAASAASAFNALFRWQNDQGKVKFFWTGGKRSNPRLQFDPASARKR